MNDTLITCPKCGAELPLTEAVTHRVREQLESDFNRRLTDSAAAFQQREDRLKTDQEALERRAATLQAEVTTQLAIERRKILLEATQQAECKLGLQIKDLETQVAEKQSRLKAAEDAELELRKRQRELENVQASLELQVTRTLDAERAKIAQEALSQAAEAERLRMADKDHLISKLQREISELQQSSTQGSVQLQGESLELTLESDLRAAFPFDEVNDVKKGVRGADVNQRVRTSSGRDCGFILWEAKRARNWSPDWPEKLKSDQRAAGADLAVLVTTCLPPGIRGFGAVESVWVCEPTFAPAVAAVLRQGLISSAALRIQQAGRADKAQALYDHLCSVAFRQHIEALVESFLGLKEQLDAEQRAFARQWKEREQQLHKAIGHTAMLYGGIQGITGREALPEIRTLALPTA